MWSGWLLVLVPHLLRLHSGRERWWSREGWSSKNSFLFSYSWINMPTLWSPSTQHHGSSSGSMSSPLRKSVRCAQMALSPCSSNIQPCDDRDSQGTAEWWVQLVRGSWTWEPLLYPQQLSSLFSSLGIIYGAVWQCQKSCSESWVWRHIPAIPEFGMRKWEDQEG